MYNLSTKPNTKMVSITFFFIILCAFQTGRTQPPPPTPTIQQQSNCFTITVVNTSDLACTQNTCGTPAKTCKYCYEITISNDKCPGLVLTNFAVSSPGDQYYDCRNICSPDGDFALTSTSDCSWQGPRTFTYTGNGGNGLTYGNSFRIFLCRTTPIIPGTPLDYSLYCVGGCNCAGSPCTNAIIRF